MAEDERGEGGVGGLPVRSLLPAAAVGAERGGGGGGEEGGTRGRGRGGLACGWEGALHGADGGALYGWASWRGMEGKELRSLGYDTRIRVLV